MSDPEDLIRALRSRGPMTARDLQRALDVSPATLTRVFRKTGGETVRVGQTRAVRYAATRNVVPLGRRAPLFLVREDGQVEPLGTLHLLHAKGTIVEYVDGRITEHPGAPWFLDHPRPQGFLGRHFVRQRPELDLPPIGRWRDDDTLRALALGGEDTPGALLVGEVSLQRFYERCTGPAAQEATVAARCRAERYPDLAQDSVAGAPPGTSAGGEQPKFTTSIAEEGDVHGVIVKFSPPLDTEVGRRWGDLLACEHLALHTLREHGLPAAQSRFFRAGGRAFLEVLRFDRVGLSGRRTVVTLLPVDAEFGGRSRTWSGAALELVEQGRLPASDAELMLKLEVFARLICNSDRHFGNVSLLWNPSDDKFRLAPIYDMLPMAFAPQAGQVIHPELRQVHPDAQGITVWEEMRDLARSYWGQVRRSETVSAELTACVDSAMTAIEE